MSKIKHYISISWKYHKNACTSGLKNSNDRQMIVHLVQKIELQMDNPTENLIPTIESAYSTDITEVFKTTIA